MKTKFKAFISLMFLFVIFISAFTYSNADEFDNSFLYCREQLSKMNNGDSLIYAYDKIAQGIENFDEKIQFNDSKYKLNEQELQTVYSAYSSDYPGHFWRAGGYGYSKYSSGQVVSMTPKYLVTKSQKESMKVEFDKAVEEYLMGITSDMSEYEKQLYIHDKLVNETTYLIEEDPICHTAYSALVKKSAVCDGYSKAFQYILSMAGIKSITVTGTADNGSGPVGHAWNIIQIDGKYYQNDITWDDAGEQLYHAYFNITDEKMLEDHFPDETPYPLPECNSSDLNYFILNDLTVSEFTVDEVSSKFEEGQLAADIYIIGNKVEFINWYKNNISLIANKIGIIGGFSYSYSVVGNEFKLKFTGTLHIHTWKESIIEEETCTKEGTLLLMCEGCDQSKNEIIPKSEHSFSTRYTVTSTSHYYECTVCREKSEYTPHNFEKTEIIKEATCTEMGAQKIKCLCGYSETKKLPVTDHTYSDDWINDNSFHWHECLICLIKIDENDHSFDEGVITKPATETEKGTAEYTCLECSYIKIVELPMLDHSHVFSDDLSFDDKNHFHKCHTCEETDNVTAHVFDITEMIKYPSCIETGLEKLTCSACGYSKNDEISIVEHKYGDEWNYDPGKHWKNCNVCGIDGDATEHKFDIVETLKDSTCTENGSEKHTCSACGFSKNQTVPKKSHLYNDELSTNEEVHWTECSFCGNVKDSELHLFKEGVVIKPSTEAEKGAIEFTCSVCSYSIIRDIPELSHTHAFASEWMKNDIQHWHECQCGERSDIHVHTYVENICSECGTEAPLYGDIDGNGIYDLGDAEYLLYVYFFKDEYSTDKESDTDSNGEFDIDDIEYLINNIKHGDDKYPLYQDGNDIASVLVPKSIRKKRIFEP